MKPFINTKETLVHDALNGFLSTCGSSLSRLDGYPHIKVVIRTDWDKSKVALLSGAGSGHEPAHPGLCCKGHAVCGRVRRCICIAIHRRGSRRDTCRDW